MQSMEDIELCKIADIKVKEKVMFSLIRNGIPYAERWDEVPLLKRGKYHGAKQICVVLTHPVHKSEAIQVIHGLDKEIQNQIIME